MTTSTTHGLEAVAARYRMTSAAVLRRCRDKAHPWPHLRPNRGDASTWLFTDADIAEIDEILRERGPITDSWGREQRGRRSA